MGDIRAAVAVQGNPLAAGHVAGNFVAGDGLAALRPDDRDIFQVPADLQLACVDRVAALSAPVECPGAFLVRRFLSERSQARNYRANGGVAIADGCEQVFHTRMVHLLADFVQDFRGHQRLDIKMQAL